MANIDKMPAGRDLDALIAEKIMGYECVCDEEPLDCPIHCKEDIWTLRPYSTDITATWPVVEHVLVHDKRLLQFRAEIVSGGKYQYAKFVDCGDDLAPVYGACAASMPLAICRAVFRAVLSEKNDQNPPYA